MALDFQVKTTDKLKPAEVAALTRLFEVVFDKPCPEDLFERKFGRSCLGWSLHSLMFLDGELIGAYSAIPVRYRFCGRTQVFAIGLDLMIDPGHRGRAYQVKRLAEELYEALALEGAAFVFGCVRDEIFQFHKAISRWRAVGSVHYYAAPFRLPYLGPASGLARAGVRIWNRLSRQPSEVGDAEFEIEKLNDAGFVAWRYGIFPSNYITVALPGGGTAIYATDLYYPIAGLPPNVRAGVLIDVFPLTKAHFDAAVLAVHRREPELNVLAYQGVLPFRARDMLRIPAKYERQAWTLAGRILDPTQIDDRVFDMSRWNINLSNGDLV
jgi:hypothetical protein